jgi:hypothetical protein
MDGSSVENVDGSAVDVTMIRPTQVGGGWGGSDNDR